MDGSPFFNIPSHGVTYYLTAVGDGDEILVMIEPGPAVGAAGVVLPLTAVHLVGAHRTVSATLKSLST